MKPKVVFNDSVNRVTIDIDSKRNDAYPINMNVYHHDDGLVAVITLCEDELKNYIEKLQQFIE